MAILEVGENHKFKKISKAISESSDQDTIQIYWGKYTESFDCNKKFNEYLKNQTEQIPSE